MRDQREEEKLVLITVCPISVLMPIDIILLILNAFCA